jgi:hypothetical protein
MSDINSLLSKEQAIEKMQQGKKVSHAYFEPEEFICMKDGKIHDENGYCLDHEGDSFWDSRKTPEWETNWLIID